VTEPLEALTDMEQIGQVQIQEAADRVKLREFIETFPDDE
jgi:uncharacterized protein YgfB (UPF0149 family)